MNSIDRVPVPYYYRAVDFDQVIREYPPPPQCFFDKPYLAKPKDVLELQTRRLKAALDRAWQVPFYAARWQEAGFAPGDFENLDDLSKVPVYTVSDIRDSIEANPPFGDYFGRDPRAGEVPIRIHSSGGTTGNPRATFYSPHDREVGNILRARSYYLHGMRPGDFVMNTLLYSTHNGAHSVHETLWQWLGCVPVATSAGIVTRTRRALEIAREWGVTVLVGFPDYLVHMAEEAKAMGMEPGKDVPFRVIETFGRSDVVSAAWGLPAYDTYGMHETQAIAAECPIGGGLHVWEDAFHVDLMDLESSSPVPDGESGSLVVTALYKDAYPIVRYDTKDVTRFLPREQCGCGSWYRKIVPIIGRGDLMIKLRGVNVWPEACGSLLAQDGRMNGEYFCIVERKGERDEMTVLAEHRPGVSDPDVVQGELRQLFRDRLQVGLRVDVVEPGSLAVRTGLGTEPKVKRLDDRRPRR